MSLIEARPTPLTPIEILNNAVDGGADVATLERLLSMQERWEASEARKAFYEAKAAAKAEIPTIYKNREGHNGKRYADFFAFTSAVDPILAKHGLSYSFRPHSGDKITVTCVLFHRLGHTEESSLDAPPDTTGNKNAVQAIGSTVTYLQRYTLGAALGLAATDDDDGRSSQEASPPISDEQLAKLQQRLDDTGSDIALFCNYMRVDNLRALTAKGYDAAMAALNAKAAKVGAQ